MTVGQLLSTTSSVELSEWRAYFRVRDELLVEQRDNAAIELEALHGADEIRAVLHRN